MKLVRRSLWFVLAFVCACGGASGSEDAARGLDAGLDEDAPTADAQTESDAPAELDAPRPDDDAAGAPDAAAANDALVATDAAFDPILVISGTCGILDTELTDELDHVIQNTSTFPEGFSRPDGARLSEGAQTILSEGTAGGSSGYSETLAFEVLHRCEGASLVASETMVMYTTTMPGAIADILVEIDGVRVGVSVVRGVTVTGRCMRAGTYTLTEANRVLARKVADIHEARSLARPEYVWTKDMVFAYADTEEHARVMREAWDMLDPALRADTILYVSVSEDMDAFVYFEDSCP